MSESCLEFKPDWISPPGDTIADLLEEKEWTQKNLASRIGYTEKHISQLIKGTVPITVETANRLEKVFGNSARFWLNREVQYRHSLSLNEETKQFIAYIPWAKLLPIKDLMEIGSLEKRRICSDNMVDIVRDLLKFFGVSSPQEWENHYKTSLTSFRCAKHEQPNPNAIITWLRLGEIQVERADGPKYNREIFEQNIEKIRSLTILPPEKFQESLQELCYEAGVYLLFIPSIKGARTSGAARWINPHKPVIQLSLYGKTNDKFWFSFFHEASHILKQEKKIVFLDELDSDTFKSDEENEADQIATEILIPPRYNNELHKLRSKNKIIEFARKLRIHPGIVVGRLQHEEIIPYSYCNGLKDHLGLNSKNE